MKTPVKGGLAVALPGLDTISSAQLPGTEPSTLASTSASRKSARSAARIASTNVGMAIA